MIDETTSQNGILRGDPDVDDARRAHVAKVLDEVKRDEKKWQSAFNRMKKDSEFVRKQLPNETENDERAKVNIVQRHIQQRVATLYAKNPTFVTERRKRLEYAVWDGKKSTLDAAAQELDATGGDPTKASPQTAALLADVSAAIQRMAMLDKIGQSLEIALAYSLDEQQPPFKPQLKQMVRRTLINTVGYCKLTFQRQLKKRPETEAKLADITDRLASIERLQADLADGEVEADSAEADELKIAQAQLQAEQDVVVREGLVFDFPRSTAVIPDRDCTQLTVGFPGARRVTERFLMTVDEIKEVYGVDIGTSYQGYVCDNEGYSYRKSDSDAKRAKVFEVYDRKDYMKYVVCEGYHDFLSPPAPPECCYVEPFFPFFPLVFNPIDEENNIFPDSDVRLLMPLQKEMNRKREAIRQHRIANRPLNVVRKGLLSEDDAKNLSHHEAHDIIEIDGLDENSDVEKAFKPFPKPGVDPNLYETSTELSDMQLVVGAQEANLGGTSGDSATENSIAEQSRITAIQSAMDDLDDILSAIARAASQILLREMGPETIKKIVGPGAIWPELTAQDIAEEVWLKIEAGSSGRPNQAQDIANMERLMPFLIQMPGVNPEWLLKQLIKRVDPNISYEEAITAGIPSIITMNRAAQPATGDPATDPAQQGGEGAQNAPNDDQSAGGAQPSYTQDPSASSPVSP
jgi:hypothetical protein